MAESSNNKMTPEQELAAHTLDRHISVTAGPGAGKTTVLVERYLHILRTQEISLDQIVAITFTNRAANEMRERVRTEMDGLIKACTAVERSRWMRYKRGLDGALINTIHGFAAGILREFPVESRVDPEFTLLEQYQSVLLEETIAERVAGEALEAGNEMITGLAAGAGRQRLVRAVVGIYRAIRGQGLSCDEAVTRTAASHATESEYPQALAELDAVMRGFLSTRRLSPTAAEKRNQAVKLWPGLRQLLASSPKRGSISEFCRRVEEFRERARPSAAGDIAPLVHDLDDLLCKQGLGGLVPRLWFDFFARANSMAVVTLVSRMEQLLHEEKQKLSALDFDDLQLRVLELVERYPALLVRAAGRYRFFLVDEFQDTNDIQRQLMKRLALHSGQTANLFIVGDRKQSIYGFRGADVEVFRETSTDIEQLGGLLAPLHQNFRSQPPLIHFFNFLFKRVFAVELAASETDLRELGYVEHEPGEARREAVDPEPLVEVLIDVRPAGFEDNDEAAQESSRELDAQQLAHRIRFLVEGRGPDGLPLKHLPKTSFNFGDIALLFRAMSEVPIYEAEFRRAGIPYQTVQGKGFYDRREIADLIQLMRFLDNTSDELALAAVLRSPLCNLSDEVLLALRTIPAGIDGARPVRPVPHSRHGVRDLLYAVRHYSHIDLIATDDRPWLERAARFLDDLIDRRTRYGVTELLRFAIDRSEYRTIISASFEGAARLANVDKLLALAESFERSAAYDLRDFVRFIHEFEEISGRESEGRIDDSANAVKLMTIHQAKGLQFPVVVIPELQRSLQDRQDWFAVDRQLGLTLKVPDGRAGLVTGNTMERMRERTKLRERFESMRLLYVAATRAKDRLILSGVADQAGLEGGRESWLTWVSKALGLNKSSEPGLISLDEDVQIALTVNSGEQPGSSTRGHQPGRTEVKLAADLSRSPEEVFPLLEAVKIQRLGANLRFSVTQLVNHSRCPRQYYFDKVLKAPPGDELAVWSDAEAAEPKANLTATLRGSVIHRFCEKYVEGQDPRECLRECLTGVIALHASELRDRALEINQERAIGELMPFARNYLDSNVRRRIETVRTDMVSRQGQRGDLEGDLAGAGEFSERSFRLRRPLGVIAGTIDKLLVYPTPGTGQLTAEIIDFKTNRFRNTGDPEAVLQEAEIAAAAYRLQMQAYALAVRELVVGADLIIGTVHFLYQNVEVSIPHDQLLPEVAAAAVDGTMEAIVSSAGAEEFPVRPGHHCRVCNFLEYCRAGRLSLRGS